MSVVEDLERLKNLKDNGTITQAEFEKEKSRILSSYDKKPKGFNSKVNELKDNIKEKKNKKIRKCKKCGNEIQEGEKFCGKCGTKIRKFKIGKYQIGIAISIVVLLAIGGIGGAIYYNSTTITDEYIENYLKEERGFSQVDDLQIEILATMDINYENYNKFLLVNQTVKQNNVDMSYTVIYLVNKKDDNIEGITSNNNLLYLLKGIANSNKSKNSPKIAEICVKYIQNKGDEFFNDTSSEDFKSLVKEIGDIVGTEKSREFIKTEYAKDVSSKNINLEYTVLFEKGSALIKYIAFYETTTEYNSNYPMSESTYETYQKYGSSSTLRSLQELFGSPYVTVKKYNVYKIDKTYANAEEFEKGKVGSYDTLKEAEEQLNVEE